MTTLKREIAAALERAADERIHATVDDIARDALEGVQEGLARWVGPTQAAELAPVPWRLRVMKR